MTVSIRRMSLGSGFEYLMTSVARGDGAAAGATSLTRYYAESGTPPGRFVGTGLAGLDHGNGVTAGTVVSEEALWRMLGMMADPVTGEPLGRRPQHWPVPLSQRVAARVATLPSSLSESARVVAASQIEAEERRREVSLARPISAFDLTFSVPKSVSTLWALADATTQATIYRSHQDAIVTALTWAENNIVFTRTGAGGAIQEDVRGVVAAAFDHWDSRAGDPHLHTHVVVANRVQAADGTWRAIDSKTLFRYAVTLSELHEGVVHDLLSQRLGLDWRSRERLHSPVPRYDIAGVPDSLIDEFSTRSRDISAAKDELIAAFVAEHGRHPSNVEVIKLRQLATLATRPEKQHPTLAELMSTWRTRAHRILGRDPNHLTPSVVDRADTPPVSAGDPSNQMLADLAQLALDTVAHKRATFTHANILAEVHRQLHGIRFAGPSDRISVAGRTAALAIDAALPLQPSPALSLPPELVRPDGTSKLRHRGADRYTTVTVFDAESRLLDASRDLHGPAIAGDSAASTRGLGDDQKDAVTAIATSGRALDLLIGPAGTGKTTSLASLRRAWESSFGVGSVVGMAPSAAAAHVLADELAVPAENTAKWLAEQRRNSLRQARIATLQAELNHCSSTASTRGRRLSRQLADAEQDHRRWTFRRNQLVIIDEASLAGTLALDAITTDARRCGAKVLLVGDWAQLGAIEAGGSFHMLATDRPDAPNLTQVRRFTNAWEAAASLRLRDGDADVIDTYVQRGRIHEGDRVTMLHALFDGWRNDIDRGKNSVMIAVDEAAVADLNALAHAHFHDQHRRQPDGVRAADGSTISVGDRIVTRRNDRRLGLARGGWVKNGDLWTITAVHRDGSIEVADRDGALSISLPADYVSAHVELGYAATVHRAQGRTVDTAHALISDIATRETLYVAATRGREANHIYVDANHDPDTETDHGSAGRGSAFAVVETVLERTAANCSAHSAVPLSQPAEFAFAPSETASPVAAVSNSQVAF